MLANDLDLKELAQIPEKISGCGAKLIYLDLAGCSFIDSRIISPIVMLQKKLAKDGCEFEIRIYDSRLLAFFREIELDRIVKIRDTSGINPIDQNNASTPATAN